MGVAAGGCAGRGGGCAGLWGGGLRRVQLPHRSCTSTEKPSMARLTSAAPPAVEVYVIAAHGSVGADVS